MISLFDDFQFHQGVFSLSLLCWFEAPTWKLVPSSVHSSADCSGFFCTVLTHLWQRSIPHSSCAIPSHCSLSHFISLGFYSQKRIFFSGFLSVLSWFGFKSSYYYLQEKELHFGLMQVAMSERILLFQYCTEVTQHKELS